MKPILLGTKKFSIKDFIRLILIIILHSSIFVGYSLILIASRHLSWVSTFLTQFSDKNWSILYPMTLGPLINAISHFIYTEKGIINARLFMWFHSLFMFIYTPLMIFFVL